MPRSPAGAGRAVEDRQPRSPERVGESSYQGSLRTDDHEVDRDHATDDVTGDAVGDVAGDANSVNDADGGSESEVAEAAGAADGAEGELAEAAEAADAADGDAAEVGDDVADEEAVDDNSDEIGGQLNAIGYASPDQSDESSIDESSIAYNSDVYSESD